MYQILLQNASTIFIFYNFSELFICPALSPPFSHLHSPVILRRQPPMPTAAGCPLSGSPAALAALSVVPQGAPSLCIFNALHPLHALQKS